VDVSSSENTSHSTSVYSGAQRIATKHGVVGRTHEGQGGRQKQPSISQAKFAKNEPKKEKEKDEKSLPLIPKLSKAEEDAQCLVYMVPPVAFLDYGGWFEPNGPLVHTTVEPLFPHHDYGRFPIGSGLMVYSKVPGYYNIHPDPKKNLVKFQVSPDKHQLVIPAYSWYDDQKMFQCFGLRVYDVSNTLLEMLKKNFLTTAPSPQNAKSVYAWIDKVAPTELGEHTAAFFIANVHYRYYTKVKSYENSLITTNNGEGIERLGHSNNGVDGYFGLFKEDLDTGRVEPKEDVIAPDSLHNYPLRNDFRVIKKSNCETQTERERIKNATDFQNWEEAPTEAQLDDESKIPVLLPGFNSEGREIKNTGYTTMFMGVHQLPMATYANSLDNLNAGFKRIGGAKPDETVLRNNAILTGEKFCKVFTGQFGAGKKDSQNREIGRVFDDLINGRGTCEPEVHLDCHIPMTGLIPDWFDETPRNLPIAGNFKDYAIGTYSNGNYPRSPVKPEQPNRIQAPCPPDGPSPNNLRQFVAEQMNRVCDESNPGKIQAFLDHISDIVNEKGTTLQLWGYEEIARNYLGFFSAEGHRHASSMIKTLKKALRIKYVNGVAVHVPDDMMLKIIEAAIKREIAKFGKAPRLYVSYGAGSMAYNHLPEFVKVCIDGVHSFSHCIGTKTYILEVVIMAKPKNKVLVEAFEKLRGATSNLDYMFAVIYSDDSCASGCMNGESFAFNVDVSSNDSSQDVPAFSCVYAAMRHHDPVGAGVLIKQCLQPIRFSSPSNPSSYFEIKFDGPFEGSGNVLTTILNHFGSLINMLAAFYLMCHKMSPSLAITAGARFMGHTVTVEECARFEDFTFLKRFPATLSTGEILPIMAPGVYLRSLGHVDRNLTSDQLGLSEQPELFRNMPFSQRFDIYQGGVIGGWVHEPSSLIMDALRTRFPSKGNFEIKHNSCENLFTQESMKIDKPILHDNGVEQAIMNRYRCEYSELQEVADSLKNLRIGRFLHNDLINKILKVDYGMS